MLTVDWVIVVEIGSLIKANQKDICLHCRPSSNYSFMLSDLVLHTDFNLLKKTSIFIWTVWIYIRWYLLRENHTAVYAKVVSPSVLTDKKSFWLTHFQAIIGWTKRKMYELAFGLTGFKRFCVVWYSRCTPK